VWIPPREIREARELLRQRVSLVWLRTRIKNRLLDRLDAPGPGQCRPSADGGRGHISKEGNRLLRWALIIAATPAPRRPWPLRAWFRGLQQRKGRKIARAALARRLTEIAYQVWQEDIDYLTGVQRTGVRG
jgi:hypothetical protein